MNLVSISALPELPLDVIEAIIDQLVGDLSSLRQCSVVSKEWRDRAQHYIFRKVMLSNQSRADALLAALHGNPALVTHIREIELWLNPIHLPLPLPTMWNIDSLCIRHLSMPNCDAFLTIIPWFASTFPRVSRLALTDSYLCSNHYMQARICLAFCGLRHLELKHNYYYTPFCSMPCSGRPSGLCRLQTVSLFGEPSIALSSLVDSQWNVLGTLDDFACYHWNFDLRANRAPPIVSPLSTSVCAVLSAATRLRSTYFFAEQAADVVSLVQNIADRVDLANHTTLRTLSLACHRCGPLGTPSDLIGLVQALNTIRHRPPIVDLTITEVSRDEKWPQVLNALHTIRHSDSSVAEFLLILPEETFAFSSLSVLESVLQAAVQT